MNHIIISNNRYLRKGLYACIKSSNTEFLWCCIDLDYCRSLHEINSMLIMKVITPRHRVFFIGNNSIYNELLKPLHPLTMNESQYNIFHYFIENKGVTVEDAKKFIISLKSLEQFTLKEKNICELLARFDVKKVARIECLSVKSIYGLRYKLAKKLHIKNQMHFKLFLFKEIKEAE